MNDQRGNHGGPPADVLSIACARWEAAVLEGRADTWTREHERTCPRCSQMGAEHDRVGALIAQATAPASIPAGFVEAVLARAEALDAGFDAAETLDLDERFEASTPARARRAPARRPRISMLWLGAAAMAAGMALAFWAGGLTERAHEAARPKPVEAAAPQTHDPAVASHTAPALAPPVVAPQPTRLLPLPTPAPLPAAAATEPPVVPSARPVPEPTMDLAGELRSSLVREIGALEGCPARAAAPIRVTVTVGTDGTLSNRQILSAADASDAHQCVGRAMDRLLLPPLDRAATITLDVNW
jgi:hypothetical protein